MPPGESIPQQGSRTLLVQRSACSNRGSPRTAAKSSSLRASSRNRGRSSIDRCRWVERVVAGVAGERREARVVVVQARVVRQVLESAADCCQRVGVPLFAVGRHRLAVERPRLTPVDPLVGLAGYGADDDDSCRHLSPSAATPARRTRVFPAPCRPPRRRSRSSPSIEHDVQLLLARAGLVVLTDQRAILAGRECVDTECVDPEALAHRNVSPRRSMSSRCETFQFGLSFIRSPPSKTRRREPSNRHAAG